MYRIFFADDERIFLEFMESVLPWKKLDCKIVGCAENGMAAVKMISELKPDICFIDISMPLIDGLEVCRKLREKSIKSRLIIMTGHDEFGFAYQAIKLGVDDFLLKPFSGEELRESLQKVISIIDGRTAVDGQVMTNGGAFSRMEDGSGKYEVMSQMIDEYLGEHYTDSNLSLQMISADLRFESSYLRRVYKITRGITIMQKLESIRMEEAKRLLNTTSMQGQEISERTGFSDQFYFSKRFKQVVGVTPTEYRSS